jgi:hypothetical protein
MAAEQLLLLNPRRKRRRKHVARRRRRTSRRHVAHRRRRHSAIVATPRRHRRRRHVSAHRRRRIRRNPRFSMRGVSRVVMPAAVGALGAVGLDVTWGYFGKFIPATVQGNVWLAAAAKIAGAFGLGWIASKAVGREQGRLVTAGAVTVVSYGLVKSLLHQAAPNLPGLAGIDGLDAYMPGQFGAYNPAPYLTDGNGAQPALGAYMPNAMAGFEGTGSEGMF